MEIIKSLISEDDIKYIEDLINKKLKIPEALFCIQQLPDHNEDMVKGYVTQILKGIEDDIIEWFNLSSDACYQRTLIKHPITKSYFLEIITKRKINNKKRYIAKVDYKENIPSIHAKKVEAFQLKTGMLEKVLIYLVAKGLVYETAYETEILKIPNDAKSHTELNA